MAATTEGKGKGAGNRFDEDITSTYQLDLPAQRTDAYVIHVYEANNDNEQFMLERFHEQSVAVEGRSAVGHLVDTRIGEMAMNTVQVMGMTMESVERVEHAAHLNRLAARLQDFDNKLLEHTGRQFLETNAIATRTMHEDMRRNVYAPPPVPPAPKRKGAVRGFAEFLFGES